MLDGSSSSFLVTSKAKSVKDAFAYFPRSTGQDFSCFGLTRQILMFDLPHVTNLTIQKQT